MFQLFLISTFFVGGVSASVLEEIIKASWDHDNFIHAQENRIKAADLDRWVRFLPNNPQISYTDADNSSWRTYGVSLNMGLPGKAFVLSKLDRELYRVEKEELAAKKNELAQFILDRYSECAAGKELLGVLGIATTELETLKRTLTARYEVGQSTQAERIGMELQYRQARIEYDSIKDKGKVACDKFQEVLNTYHLNYPFEEKEFFLPDDLSDELISQMGKFSVDYIRADNDLRLAQVKYDTAFWDGMPDLTLGYYRNNYNRVQASPIVPVQWTNTFMVSVNIPLFYPFYNGNNLRRVRAENMISERRARMKKLESEQDMLNARNEYRRNKLILEKLRSHDLPMAETMVDSTLASYKAGKLGFSELILSKRTWLDLKKEEVSLRQTLLNARLRCLNSCEVE